MADEIQRDVNMEESTAVDMPDYANPWAAFNCDNAEALRDARMIRRQSSSGKGGNLIPPVPDEDTIKEIDYTKYDYDFENIVFEGGGAKGIVYVGAMQVLEEVGVKPKRYAGASAGAMVSALAAVGYKSAEIDDVLKLDLEALLLDHSWGYLSLLPNLINHYGWNPANKLTSKFRELIAAKTGDPKTTFQQLYDKTGVELCIMAVNVNMMRAEYFHVKTTPHVEICQAVRMSMSIPGVFQPVPLKTDAGTTDLYVDGGVLCNYPIHAYDGWWLSMLMEDSFLHKLQPISDFTKLIDKNVRFATRNNKTLGFMVYSDSEQDLMKQKLEQRVGITITNEDRPKTKLFRKKEEDLSQKNNALEDHVIFMGAMGRFVEKLNEIETFNGNHYDRTDIKDLKKCLSSALPRNEHDPESKDFSTYDIRILFGDNHNLEEIFALLDQDKTGTISYEDLVRFVSKAGVNINKRYQGYDRQNIDSLGDFFSVLTSSWMTNSTKMYLTAEDVERTVGINCDYLETMDFEMEPEDREFAKQQGRRATISFLKHNVHSRMEAENDTVF